MQAKVLHWPITFIYFQQQKIPNARFQKGHKNQVLQWEIQATKNINGNRRT